ncbi:sulfite reductase (NADPH) flavoprotein alpha-component [Scopulibacillus daqui]|uniref:Sulfite reductase (NADPH) flavoprotein alpha-component n=1 Tax=Scopulibacillus daqui TaxID=1469162 RepID=A0ABS2Q002_9BACL|nr:assimilatory sulfite reductase (NADPH) flavoprotein subunit [Scopulibacillus daqui]MBM7645150.1 sulfite reductase (NADPH) flavoprotein alpha-component [Scopulibacillus daqui]
MKFEVTNSPFSQEQAELLNRLLPTLTEKQKIWLSGFFAHFEDADVSTGDSAGQKQLAAAPPVDSARQDASREVTILFGSETGNAQSLAEDVHQKLKDRGFQTTLSSMDDFKPKNIKKVQDLLIITATHGEGDPPDNARSFYEFLNSRKAPKLEGLRFSVLSLGDQSYEFFCQTGKDFDKRLEELGGERFYARVDCDVDFDEPAAAWIDGILSKLEEDKAVNPANEQKILSIQPQTKSQPKLADYSRTNPFKAEVIENLKLNGRGSNKETRHLELSLEGSNLAFEPGDSLGIFPKNAPGLADSIINQMNWKPEDIVTINKQGETLPLREALISHYEITRLTKPMLTQAAQLFSNERLNELLKPGHEEELRAYLDGRDLLDFVRDFSPKEVPSSEFVHILRKMPPRLYSISSSLKANPDEVHLTMGTVRYKAFGRNRIGVCSGQCAERVEPGDFLPVYIHRNPNFKFPSDPDTPIIMVGPGTGVAPFRSFLQEREETGVKGKTWLFFGDQHFKTDFLYQVEWQKWLKDGVLSKMDVAFSRDSAKKVYVQHRMLEKSRDIYQWLEEGASLYICGDEKNMAKDVHQTLTKILEKEGGLNREEAENYLTDMRHQKRYQRDVY